MVPGDLRGGARRDPLGTLTTVDTVALSLSKDWAIIVGSLIALVTFLTGVMEYARQGHHRRAEHFLQMRRRFLETPEFRLILEYLQRENPKLDDVSIQDKRNFVGFLEEVALMVNSGLIRLEVARYMFGYYVHLVRNSDRFWQNLDRDSEYWTVFREFADRLGQTKSPVSHRIRF